MTYHCLRESVKLIYVHFSLSYQLGALLHSCNYSACTSGSLGVRDSQKLAFDFQNLMPGSQLTSNIIIIYTSKIEYLLVLCVYIDIKMIFSHIIEEKNNIKIKILEEAKFMIEHDFQMMNPGSHVTSVFGG